MHKFTRYCSTVCMQSYLGQVSPPVHPRSVPRRSLRCQAGQLGLRVSRLVRARTLHWPGCSRGWLAAVWGWPGERRPSLRRRGRSGRWKTCRPNSVDESFLLWKLWCPCIGSRPCWWLAGIWMKSLVLYTYSQPGYKYKGPEVCNSHQCSILLGKASSYCIIDLSTALALSPLDLIHRMRIWSHPLKNGLIQHTSKIA